MSVPSTTEQSGKQTAETRVKTRGSGAGLVIKILLGLTLAGMLGGCLLGLVVNNFPKGSWVQLDLGQDKVIRILGTDDRPSSGYPTSMYLEMTSGDVYRCHILSAYDRCNKVTTEQVSNKRYECPNDYRPATPSIPGQMIDSLCLPAGMGGSLHIAILTDGSVWEWLNARGEFDVSGPFAAGGGSLVGLVVGLIAGIFAAIFWIARRKRSDRCKIQSTAS